MELQEIKKRVDAVNAQLMEFGASFQEVEDFWKKCIDESRRKCEKVV